MARIKRMLCLILCFALVAGYIPAPVSAEEVSQQVQEEMEEPVAEVTEESVTEETEAPTTEATEPETEATEEPATEATKSAEEVCTGLADCAAEEHAEDCEKPAAEKAAADQAAADEVAALIAGIPSLEAIQEKSLTDQQADYNQVQDAYEAYCALTSDQQALLPPAEEVFKPYFDYFNAQTEAAADHSHPVCGGSCGCASDTHTSYTWTAWDGTTKLMNGNYYLTTDLVLDSTMILDYSYSTKLCLNGHSITCEDTVFDIYSYRSLLITDCVGTGKVESAAADCTIGNNKFLSIWGGAIRNTSAGGSAIDAYAGTTTYVCGGLVEGNAISTIYMYPGSDVRIQDGTVHNIRNCYAISGLCQSGTHTLSNLTVSGGNLTTEGSKLVVEVPCGNFTMSGGYIDGDVIVYSEEGTTTVSGGTIDGMLDVGSQTASITGGDMCLHLSGTGKAEIHAGKFRDYCIFWTPEVTVTGGDFSAAEGVVINGKTWICGGSFSNVSASMGSLYLSGVPTIDTLQVYKPSLVSAQSEDGTGSYGGDPIAVWLNNSYESVNWTNGTTIIRNVTSDAVAQKFQLKETDEPWMSLKHSGNNLILKVLPHGTCGDNLTWMFDETTGTLTISGSGEMTDYTSDGSIPWEDYWDKIKTIVMEDTVTSIGNYAFAGLNYLESVTLSGNLTRIGRYAFSNAGTSLSTPSIEITVPATVTAMGDYAFVNAKGIAKVTLAEGITTVGYGSFMQCSGLTEVVFPASVTKIDNYAFENARNITSIIFMGKAPTFGSMVFRNITAQVSYPGNDATWTADVKQNYGGTLTWICEACKAGHTEVVDEAVAATCTTDGLTEGSHCDVCGEILVAQTVVPSAGNHSFVGSSCEYCGVVGGVCGETAIWTFDGDTKTLTISGTGAITSNPWQNGYSTAYSLIIEDGITQLFSHAFRNMPKLSSVRLPSGLTEIPSYCFESDVSLASINIPDSVTTIGEWAFGGTGFSTFTIPDSVTSEVHKVVSGSNLKEICIGAGAQISEENWSQFGPQHNLQSYIVSADNPYYTSQDGVLYTKDMKTLVNYPGGKAGVFSIPEGVETINSYAFEEAPKITEIHIPASVKVITENQFGSLRLWNTSSLQNIHVDENNAAFSSKDGVLYNKDKTILFCCGPAKEGTVSIAEGTWEIGSYAFQRCSKLTNVELPDSLEHIGMGAFRKCSSLQNIVIPASITSWRQFAFQECTSLAWIACGVKNGSFYQDFDSCYSLRDVYYYGTEAEWNTNTISNYDAYVKSATKHYNSGLPGTWPVTYDLNGGTNHGDNPSVYYNYGDDVTLFAPVREGYNFEGWYLDNQLKEEASAPQLTRGYSSGEKVFYAKWSVDSQTHVHQFDANNQCECGIYGGTCGDNLTWVFDETTGTLTISGTGEMYSYEDDDAPWDDYKSQITSILLPEGLTQVGYSAFDRTAITSITIPDSVTRINDYAFSSCSSLTDVDLGDGCSIYECAFYACPVKNLNLGHSGYFGFQAFTSSYITSITIAASRAQFDDGAFWNAGVKEVHFTGAAPGSVTDKDIMTGSTVSSFRDVTWYYDCSQSGWTTSSRYDAANKTWAGYTLVSENHVPVTDEAVAATCTTDGLTKGSHCSVCGEVIVAQEVIPAGHTVVDGICTGCQNYGECGNGIYWKRDENYTMTFYGTGVIESGSSSGNPAFDLLVHNIIISEGITDIGTGLFGYLGRAYLGDGLQSVNIASTVTAIGANAFANCGNVSSINFNGDAPAIDANAFAGLTAIASYSDGNDTWTDVIKETYGGNITWVAVGSDSSEPSEPVPTTPPEETEPTEDGLVDLTIYAYYYVDSEYHHKTKLLTQQFVQDSLSNSMVPWLYGDGISAVKAALDKLGDAGGYLRDPIVFYNCIGDSEISEGDVMVADGNKAVYVKVESNKAVEATILLQIHTAQEDAIARTVTMPGYVIGDTVSAADVLTKVGEYYTGDNMTMSDLYDAVSWEDLLSGLEASGATAIKVAGDTVEIHVILTDAEPVSPVIGTVKQNLNVRSAPSTTASIVKQLEAGTQVEILKTQTVMDVEWGLTADGWIVMAYVDLLEASGTCGENLTWEFYKSTGTLKIFGTGDMDSFAGKQNAPWDAYKASVTKVVIDNGVTSIGDSAFYGYNSLTDIKIPETVTAVGVRALADCGNLLNIQVDDNNPDFAEGAYGGLYSKDQSILYQIPAGAAGSCTVPKTVTRIGSSAFEGCRNLTEILIPEDITTIGSSAFYNCSSLTAITLPVGITEISTSTFKNCTNLREITIPESVVSIGSGAFYDCLNLSVITFRGDAPTISAGSKITIKPFYNVKATAYYPADNATWTEEVMQDCGGTLTWVPYGQAVENRVSVSLAELNGQASVWIDGREYAVQTDGDMAYVDLPDGNAKTMMVYTYHVGDAADIHTQYPIGMKVWLLENTSGYYTAARTEAFDDILQYAGMSIRVFGQKGIRMITSIDQATKTALTSGGLEGYTLKEYGTVIAWDSYLTATKPLVLDASYAKYNYAYKQGIADPVFQYVGDRMQYTNVLVDFTNDQCKNDLAMRPYMILEHENGERITLYGGIVRRSIGYIAYQNRNVFEPGSDPYEYVWEIIRYVYGTKYDKEYIISWSPPAM